MVMHHSQTVLYAARKMNKKWTTTQNHTELTIEENVWFTIMSKNTNIIISLHERWMFQINSKKSVYFYRFLDASLGRTYKTKRKNKRSHRPFENRQSLWKISSFFFLFALFTFCFFCALHREIEMAVEHDSPKDYGEKPEMSCLSGAKAENDQIVDENGVWCCCCCLRAQYYGRKIKITQFSSSSLYLLIMSTHPMSVCTHSLVYF